MFSIKKTNTTGRYELSILGIKAKFRLPKSNGCGSDLLTNLLYELADPRTLEQTKLPKVSSLEDSVYSLIDSDKSLARYGDGEFKLMNGENISFQKADPVLAERLKEIIKNQNDKILVGLPDIFGFVDNDYMRKVVVLSRKMLYELLDFSKLYVNASCTRQYVFSSQSKGDDFFNNFKRVWADKEIVVVEGEGSRLGVGNDLFSGAKDIKRILCPIKDAFSKYNDILNECKKQPQSKLFIIALGPTATVLAEDLANAGYRALDLGHIDTFYEMYLRKAQTLQSIEGKIVFNEERHKNLIPECKDENYHKQIIAKIV